MAVTRPQSGPALTGVHIALIAFVAVTVVALVFLVLLYTGQEDLKQRAEKARSDLTAATTTANEKQEQYKAVAKLLTGQPDAEPATVDQEAKQVRQVLTGIPDLPNSKSYADFPLVTAFRELAKEYVNRARQAKTLEDANKQANDARAQLETTLAQREKEFGEKSATLETNYKALKKEADDAKAQWKTRLEKYDALTEVTQRAERAEAELKKAQADIEALKKDLAKKQERVEGLVGAMEKFRPSHDARAVLQQAKGKILRILPDDSVVYINLGKRDRVMTGMTFAVYAPAGGVTKEGRGKATIEVVTVLQETSECKVTSVEPGSRIVVGDLIANPVYDRNRRFNFCVAGDFDLGFGTTIDDPDGVKVKKLIESWGGRVVPTVDEQTDFVVLGIAPEPVRATANTPDALEAARVKNEEITKRVNAYKQIKADATALGIPVLTRLQFLDFIGYRVPVREITFVVVGNFSTRNNGVMDDKDGVKMKARIREWGGRVADTVDEWTGYVVLGSPPEQKSSLDAFNEAKDKAQLYFVPTLTQADLQEFFKERIPGNVAAVR